MADYDVGDVVRLSADFTVTSSGASIDPAVVKVEVTTPAGVVSTLIYGTDAAVIKDSIGHYHYDLDIAASGMYRYCWYSTGAGKALERGVLKVH